jgi:hypothetical protein
VADAVTELRRPRDTTGAARQRRFRERRRQPTVTDNQAGVTPNRYAITIEMCALSGRLSSGSVTDDDLELAGRLILHLVRRLPEGAVLDLGLPARA